MIVPEEDFFVLSNLSPSPAQKRLALFVVLCISTVSVLITAGLSSSIRLGVVPSFVPIYATAMIVNDSITAILLFAQFSILRSRATLMIASGYLFTALILIPWFLTVPGAFAPGGLIGGFQSTSGLYFFWHVGFALLAIGYALSKDAEPSRRYWRGTVRRAIILSVALTVAAVSAAAFLCIAGEPLLPVVLSDTRNLTPLWLYVVGVPVGLISIAALVVLWVRRRSVLDLWLMVVMVTFVVDPILSYYPIPSRFSVGWYAVRIFGLLSSSVVLVVLLYEISALYAQLVGAVRAQRREREARLMTGDAVAATIAHEVRQPLAAMITRSATGFRWLDRPAPDLDKAKEAFKHIATDGERAAAIIESIRVNFRNDDRVKMSLDLNDLIRESVDLARDELDNHRVLVKIVSHPQKPRVIGDRIQLQQVLLNLITNAIDSMAEKETARELRIMSEVRRDGVVETSVQDSGTGINPQNFDRVFNPLFTTKLGGMGMGLSICRSIIEAHEGQLWVVPDIPSGSVFRFALRADIATPVNIG